MFYIWQVTYDIVVASFALSELPRAALRKVAISSLWGKTNDFLVGSVTKKFFLKTSSGVGGQFIIWSHVHAKTCQDLMSQL